MSAAGKRLSPDAQALLAVLQDIALGADMMLQPIPLLSANRPLVRYAAEVKRVSVAAITAAEQLAQAPSSWEVEDHSPPSPWESHGDQVAYL